MKKTVGTIIDFKVRLTKSNKTFRFSMSHVTRLRHISIQMCKLLNLDRFNTKIVYSIPHFPHKVSETSTLRHLKLKNGSIINAEVKSTNTPTPFETRTPHFKDSMFGNKTNLEGLSTFKTHNLDSKMFHGLNAVVYCQNKRCRAFQMMKVETMGFGTFNYGTILHNIRCTLCPHKGISWTPMRVVQVSLKKCSWQADGEKKMKSGVINHENYGGRWFGVDEIDNETFKKVLYKNDWEYLVLKVRPRVTASVH